MASTVERDTVMKGPPLRMYDYQMAASTTIRQGWMVGVNAAGLLVPMTAVNSLRCVGRAEETKTSAASGATFCKVYSGTFKWKNHGTNTVVAANRQAVVYAEDNDTVGNVAGSLSVCGIVEEIESDGVWVRTDPAARS